MSVFDLPRLHFEGIGTTRTPTGPREEFGAGKGSHFDGNGHFRLDAKVVGVETASDTGSGAHDRDPVVGGGVDVWGHYNPYLRSTVNRARVLDVDPASRWTTALMVGRFALGRRGRSHDDGYLFTGGVEGMHPPRRLDLGPPPDHEEDIGADPPPGYRAVHQFVCANSDLDWPVDPRRSPAAAALRTAAAAADGVVVRLALDDMRPPTGPDEPTAWRVRGTVAPWHAHELRTYPAGRPLVPLPGSPLGHVAVRIAHGRAILDVITALPPPGRPGPSVGDLELRTLGTDHLIACVPSAGRPAEAPGGIVTVRAEPGWRVADEQALYVVGFDASGRRVPFALERETTVATDEALPILHHRDRARDHAVAIPLRVHVRGRPAGPGKVYVRQYFNPRAFPDDIRAGAPHARCPDAVVLGLRGAEEEFGPECVVETDHEGRGVLTLRGERAGACRVLLAADPAEAPPIDPDLPGSAWAAYDDANALGFWAGAGSLTARVLPNDWHLDEIPRAQVDFDLVHREVFAHYERVSSFMRSQVFSLADRCKVETYAELIWQMCDPANKTKTFYMPPGRDLTDPKARLLFAYLRNLQAGVRAPTIAPGPPASMPVITTRGQLWAALKQAATIELAVMLQYLYAAFSLPTHGAGLTYVRRGDWTPRQLELACGGGGAGLDDGIRGLLLTVAREEMIHFLLVNNIIMAMGEPFHVPMIDFATLDRELPVPLDFALEPLGLGSVERFVDIERPAALAPRIRGSVPTAPRQGLAWGSPGELYAGIREGLHRVPNLFLVEPGRGGGEHHLFLRESIDRTHPDYQAEVDDLSSALFAVDLITEQGEGGLADGRARFADAGAELSHHRTFLRIRDLLTTERVPGAYDLPVPWSPAYPVLRNPTLRAGDAGGTTITDPDARAVAALFNHSYHLMLHLMAQHFTTGPDTSLRRSKPMEASIDVMTGMMRPLAELLVTMDSGRHGRTAGPTFELDSPPATSARPDVARRSAALRFAHLAAATRRCEPVPERVGELMEFYAERFGAEDATGGAR